MLQSSAEALAIWWEKATSQEMLAQVQSPILYEALLDQWWGSSGCWARSYLHPLKPLVDILPPEVEPVQDGAILVGQEGGQLQHPLPPLASVHSHPLP